MRHSSAISGSAVAAPRAHEAVGGAERLDLTVLLGAGERHGADAVRWTVEHLAEPASAGPLRVELPGHGRRTTHPFPFSDQHTLPRTLGISQVTTRLCLDSRLLTASLFALQPAAQHPAVRRALAASFRRVHLGSDRFAVRVDAYRGDRHAAYALTGRQQSRVTGLVAAHATRELLTGSLPPGSTTSSSCPRWPACRRRSRTTTSVSTGLANRPSGNGRPSAGPA